MYEEFLRLMVIGGGIAIASTATSAFRSGNKRRGWAFVGVGVMSIILMIALMGYLEG